MTVTIAYEVDPAKLSELENTPEHDLKDFDFNTVEYPSYEKLFESKYKQRFLKNIPAIQSKEIEKRLGRETLDRTAKRDRELRDLYAESMKERDLDNDGVPDRIDIDDTRNSVQNVSDLNIVKNSPNKEMGREKENKERTKQRMDIEL